MKKAGLPPETSLDEVKVRIKESYRNPNVGKIHQVVLKDGPRMFRTATLLEIINPNTGDFHHYSLKIDSIDKTKSGWFHKPERSIRLEGESPDEIEHLYRFLSALMEGSLSDRTGELHIIGSDEYTKLENLLDIVPILASADKIELLKVILPNISGEASYIKDFIAAFRGSEPETVRNIAIASRIVEYRKACNRLAELVKDDKNLSEHVFQKHLEENPWMFGSEYSELLDRRTWTRDDSLDFMLRRTVDNFLEIVEIKTPFREPLLLHDKSHDSYYPSAKLSNVLGQVMRYIEEVERDRDSILSKDRYDTLKIRARVIIGRDGTESQQVALRNLNAHLHSIEVITFDQLLRIGERVLSVFEREPPDVETDVCEDEDIPF